MQATDWPWQKYKKKKPGVDEEIRALAKQGLTHEDIANKMGGHVTNASQKHSLR